MTTLANDYPNGPSYLAEHLEAQLLVKAAKKGEGSRGGHIIGHTKSGKPVYSPGPGNRYKHMADSSGYFKHPQDVSQRDARIVMGHYPGFSAADHEEAGRILEDPNHHTAAAAHFMAAQELAYSSGHEKSQASMNNHHGASALSQRGLKSAGGPMGRSFNGHLIPDATSRVYSKVHTADGLAQAASRVEAALPGFDKKDHLSAADAHHSEGTQLAQVASERLASYPNSEFGQKLRQRSQKHYAAGDAHRAAAERLG